MKTLLRFLARRLFVAVALAALVFARETAHVPLTSWGGVLVVLVFAYLFSFAAELSRHNWES